MEETRCDAGSLMPNSSESWYSLLPLCVPVVLTNFYLEAAVGFLAGVHCDQLHMRVVSLFQAKTKRALPAAFTTILPSIPTD